MDTKSTQIFQPIEKCATWKIKLSLSLYIFIIFSTFYIVYVYPFQRTILTTRQWWHIDNNFKILVEIYTAQSQMYSGQTAYV
jgi:hypothetical protein